MCSLEVYSEDLILLSTKGQLPSMGQHTGQKTSFSTAPCMRKVCIFSLYWQL